MSTLRTKLPELVLLANAVAFVVVLAELLIMEHTDGLQRLAPAAAALGGAVCLLAVLVKGRPRYAFAAVLTVLALAGVWGFYLHMDARSGLTTSALSPRGEERSDGSAERRPAPFAPLSIAGAGLLSAIAAAAGAGVRETAREPARAPVRAAAPRAR